MRARHRKDGAGMGWELCAEDPLQKQVYFVLGVRVIRVGREEPLLPRLGLHRGWHSFPTYTPMLMPPSALILDVFIFQTDIQRVNRVCFHSWKPLDLSGEREKALCRKLSDCFSETLVDVFIDKSTQNREGNWKPRVHLSSLGSRLCSGVGDKT